jgi:hypothetical protein
VLAGLAASSRRWLAAGLLGVATALGRPQSALIALPLAAAAAARASPPRRVALGAAAAPLAALAVLWGYLWWKVGDPHAWSHAEDAWGRSFGVTAPLDALRQVVHAPYGDWHEPYVVLWLLRDLVFTAIYVVLLVAAARARVPRVWILYGFLLLVVPLFSGSFTSMARYGLLAFPIFAGLAWIGRGRASDLAIKTTSLVSLAVFVGSLAYRYP